MNFGINTEAFLKTLPLMGKGMLGIFIITIVIVASMMLLNRLGSGEEK